MPATQLTTPLGTLYLTTHQNALTSLCFDMPEHTAISDSEDPLIQQIKTELTQWFKDPKTVFTVPLNPTGTPFQLKVWQALQQIPCGETRTYSTLAAQLNTHARAIGSACRANPLPIIIPCHRVVAKQGLGGYTGATEGEMIRIKSCLLALEKSTGKRNSPGSSKTPPDRASSC